MCMFYGRPTEAVITTPRLVWKSFSDKWRRGRVVPSYPPTRFLIVDAKVQTGRWMIAKGYKGKPVEDYGFHVYHTHRAAVNGGHHHAIPVFVAGRVFGEDSNGMRVERLFVPAKPILRGPITPPKSRKPKPIAA